MTTCHHCQTEFTPKRSTARFCARPAVLLVTRNAAGVGNGLERRHRCRFSVTAYPSGPEAYPSHKSTPCYAKGAHFTAPQTAIGGVLVTVLETDARCGQFEAWVGGQLATTSPTPLLTTARALLAEGVTPELVVSTSSSGRPIFAPIEPRHWRRRLEDGRSGTPTITSTPRLGVRNR